MTLNLEYDSSVNQVITFITGKSYNVDMYYYGADTELSAPIDNNEVISLDHNGTFAAEGTTFEIDIAVGDTRICFAYPNKLRDVYSVKYLEIGSGEVKDTFDASIVSVLDLDTSAYVDYKVYTSLVVPVGSAMTYEVTI